MGDVDASLNSGCDWLTEAYTVHKRAMLSRWRNDLLSLYRYRSCRAAAVRDMQALCRAATMAGCPRASMPGVSESLIEVEVGLAALGVRGTGAASINAEYILQRVHEALNDRAVRVGRLDEMIRLHSVDDWAVYEATKTAGKQRDSEPADVDLAEDETAEEDDDG